MGKIGNRQSTFRNNLYDWFSRFNILLCYFLRNSFPDLNSASDLQKKGNLWCQTSGCVEVSSLLPLCNWLHLGTVHSGIITFLFWLLPPISFPGRKDRQKAWLYWSQNIYHWLCQGQDFACCIGPVLNSVSVWPGQSSKVHFYQLKYTSAMVVCWSNLN